MDSLAEIKDTFFQECEEQLAELESGLLSMEGGATDGETINAVFRAVHSVKGGAGAFGLEALIRFAHVFETALDEMRSNRLAPEPHVLKVLLRAADVLADLVRAARDDVAVDESRAQDLSEAMRALCAHDDGDPAAEDDADDDFGFQPLAAVSPAAPSAWRIHFRPRADLYAKGNEAGLLLRELAQIGACEVELDVSALPPLAEIDPDGAYLAWTVILTANVDRSTIAQVFEFVDGDCDLSIEPSHVASDEPPSGQSADVGPDLDIAALLARVQSVEESCAPSAPLAQLETPILKTESSTAQAGANANTNANATIRVDLDRVDRLIDLVGELVINQAMLSQRVMEAGLARASSVVMGLDELEQLTREIQDSVMAIRAQPVKSVFQRMPRLAREVAAMTGKPVRLITEGETTEVDKTVIERIADPLTHMIRNAIDHGLERPEARAAAGKPAEGVVRLSAAHRSGRIVIEVSDDGGGIDRARVRAIAVERGVVPPDAVLSDEETDNLIFMPGFSTASTVSDISGRGVGMDVVRRSIQALGGRISISSRPGKGSTFTMSLPLTLAVLDGMVVMAAGQTLVAPLTAVVETLQPKSGDISCLAGDARVIAIRGAYTPVIDVGVALGFRATPQEQAPVALLIEGEDGSQAALMVDQILGQRQVVIKSLEANYRQVPGVAAATVLGDGRVALILDIDTIVSASRGPDSFRPERLQAAG